MNDARAANSDVITAAILVNGDEILTGRTRASKTAVPRFSAGSRFGRPTD